MSHREWLDPEVLDGWALWEEHKPQTGEDWVKVAERVIADGDSTEKGSPLFAAVGIAVRQRDQLQRDLDRLLETVENIRTVAGDPAAHRQAERRLYKLAEEIEQSRTEEGR